MTSPVLLLATALHLASGAFPADASTGQSMQVAQSGKDSTPEKGADKELGFFERYFPFTMHETFSEPVQEILVGVWIGAFFCPGIGVLVGNLMLGDRAPEESDLLAIALWHIGLRLTSLVLALPTGGLTTLVTLTDMAYLAPVAILNGFDRAIAAPGSVPGTPEKKSTTKDARTSGGAPVAAVVSDRVRAMAY